MQIKKIVLYGKNENKRELEFNLGEVNIISGKSKTGKSVIGDIIEYCFGGDSCNIAIGTVRNKVVWYGLLLEHEGEYFFVGRQNPEEGQSSTNKCCYQFGIEDVPNSIESAAPIDNSGLVKLISEKIGISENLLIPPIGQSRRQFSANIKHALFYCIQAQDEIAAQKTLFHRQAEPFMIQAIKDTLPYFLGIINEEYLSLESERMRLQREQILLQRSIDEVEQLQGNGFLKAIELISEAKEVGLLSDDNNYNDYQSVKDALQTACNWIPNEIKISGVDRISCLQEELQNDEVALENIGIDIRNANEFIKESNGYKDEIEHQKNRLESIELFKVIDFDSKHCPFCSAKLDKPLSFTDNIKDAIKQLSSNLVSVSKEKPHINDYIESLYKQKQDLEDNVKNIRLEIEGIYNENKGAINLRDLNSRRARVVGRISLWLESVNIKDDTIKIRDKIKVLQDRISDINDLLSVDLREEKKQSILSELSMNMSIWAKQLNLEHSDYPYRLDLNKVTVIVDKERPVPLQQLGSGANWLGCHLITLFALHKYFIQNDRPVPHFLFIDQPSQVYFPPETYDKNVDSEEIRSIFKFIYDFVKKIMPKMQVIIVDHADIKEDYFQNAIIEKWWNDSTKLVPPTW